MILIPQIYLRNGKVVVLEGTTSPLIQEDPIATAQSLKDSGAEALQVIDLGVPHVGTSPHLPILRRMRDELKLALFVGGAFKAIPSIEGFINAGFEVILLDSIAYQQPAFLADVAKKFPARIGVHIDVKANHVTIPGYAVVANKTAFDYAERFVDAGVRYLFYSEVGANGLMGEEHFERFMTLCKQVTMRIICTSEIASLADVERLTKLAIAAPRLDGLVLGKSLADGRIDLRAAVALVNDLTLASGDESTLTEM